MKRHSLFLALAAIILLPACTKHIETDFPRNSIRVNINVVSDIITRANASGAENLVSSFDIYVFDADTGILESFEQNIAASTPIGGDIAGEIHVGEATISVTDDNDKNILAIANASGNSLNMPVITEGVTTYASMLESVTLLQTNSQPSSPFVMSGYRSRVNVYDNPSITVSMCRRVSRLIVTNMSESDGLTISTIKVTNAVNQSYLFQNLHPQSATGLGYVDYGEVSVQTGTDQVLYVFPQPAATNDMKLVVTGTLKNKPFTEIINLIPKDNGTYVDMEHNTSYKVRISADIETVSADLSIQTIEDWGEGNDIDGTITHRIAETYSTVTVNGLTLMDRNLGATSTDIVNDWDNAIGNFYQWGRNTAFSAAGTHGVVAGPLTSDAATAQENLEKFITKASGDWLNGTDDSRWQSVSSQPCPDGFRIPTAKDFRRIFTSSTIQATIQTVTIVQENFEEGSFWVQYIGDGASEVYGLKKQGTSEASYMKWEDLQTAAGKHYIKISLWDAGSAATFEGKTSADVKSIFASLGLPKETAEFPQAGKIAQADGSYQYSTSGSYWTSTLSGSGVCIAELNPINMLADKVFNNRTTGFSVRCVKQ